MTARRGLIVSAAAMTACAAICICLNLPAVLALAARTPNAQRRVAGYSTSLEGRTPNQRLNAVLAAQSLNGKVIPAGATFSFNRVVRSWTPDRGYGKAPVSFDGELLPAYGGGVCQTSTTLYNAALLAGLEIVSRSPHVFAPSYVPPGRDAAVAYPNIDLCIRNPYPVPLKIVARADGSRLLVELRSSGSIVPPTDLRIESRVLNRQDPRRRVDTASRAERGEERYGRNPGATGWRVVTYRVSGTNRERLSDDSYPAMDRTILLNP